MIIGGAGTGTPPVEVEVEPPLEVEVELEVELALDVELALLVLLDVLVPPPKLLDEEVVETLPLDVVEETPPVEVELEVEPPLVEDELPPVEVELPPVEVEPPLVEVEPPLVEVEPPEVEMVTTEDELPPMKLPLKKPAPKPEPKPRPSPVAITIGAPPLVLLGIANGGTGGGAKAMGGAGTIVRVVTVWPGVATQLARRTVRRTTRRCWVRARRKPLFAFACLTIAGRAGGFSATWTAPPPMIAPPQVQAQSFAKAIPTDITASLFLTVRRMEKGSSPISISRCGSHEQMPAISLSASALTTLVPEKGWICPSRTASVPLLNSFLAGVNGARPRRLWPDVAGGPDSDRPGRLLARVALRLVEPGGRLVCAKMSLGGDEMPGNFRPRLSDLC